MNELINDPILAEKIRDYIKCWYNAEYKGLLKVEKWIDDNYDETNRIWLTGSLNNNYFLQDLIILEDGTPLLHTPENIATTYKFTIGIPSYMVPTTIVIQCYSDNEFLNYIYSELRTRNYIRLDIYKVTRNSDTREE